MRKLGLLFFGSFSVALLWSCGCQQASPRFSGYWIATDHFAMSLEPAGSVWGNFDAAEGQQGKEVFSWEFVGANDAGDRYAYEVVLEDGDRRERIAEGQFVHTGDDAVLVLYEGPHLIVRLCKRPHEVVRPQS